MDEQLVLTAQTLRLNPHVQRAEVAGVTFVVKNVLTRKYLTVTAEQWNLLRNFANPATVPDVLRAVILNRSSLPLREYYELILKALRAGVLNVDKAAETRPAGHARRWFVTLGPSLPLVLTWVSAAAALGLLAAFPFPWPGPWPSAALNLLIGWAMLSAEVSLGKALAASVLRGGGGEVYDPRFNLWRPVPYFSVCLDDACMCNRQTQAAVWSVSLFPVLVGAAAVWWFRPEWGTLHVPALIVMLHPFDGSAATNLLSTVCRGQVLDTQRDLLFGLNQHWRIRFKFSLQRVSAKYVFARLAWGLFWALLVLFCGLKALNMSRIELFGSRAYWQEAAVVFVGIVIAAVMIYVGPPLIRYFVWRFKNSMSRERMRWARWRLDSVAPVHDEPILRVMSESLLLRRLPAVERKALSQCGQPRFYKAFSMVQKFGEVPPYVSLIISGEVTVYRRLKSGRPEKAMRLKEGDIFGAHSLTEAQRQQYQVRAMTPLLVLTIPVKDFQRRVVGPLGGPMTDTLLHKAPFLRELSLCEGWHPQAVARFAQLANVMTFNSGDVIVAERQDTQQFYVVYEGRVLVSSDGKTRSRVRTGGFFGEISLMQNSSAVSDIVAQDETRCLVIAKADFLRFVTHNPRVAIQLEEISSRRLGRPVFPCMFHSFEVR